MQPAAVGGPAPPLEECAMRCVPVNDVVMGGWRGHFPAVNTGYLPNQPSAQTGLLVVFMVALLFLAGGCASARSAPPSADDARGQIEVRLHEILAAAEQKDFERLDGYHLYGPAFSRFSGSSSARLDADATRRLEHAALGSIEGLKTRMDDLKIDVFGDVAVATFILDYSFQAGDKPVHAKERSTLVMVEERGEWRIAHEHLSTIAP
jgi:ketosteroid isomerase-like protein